MKSLRFLWITALLAAGCATKTPEKKDAPKEKPVAEAPKLVGRIASIPQGKRFVLIQSYEKWTVEAGTVLTTRGTENRSANLITTGEKLGQFAAADIQSGTVETGDAVYSRHTPKPEETPAVPAPSAPPGFAPVPELPANQPNAAPENVQKNI